MSKIFDAYRKQAGAKPDLAVEIGRATSLHIFPVPKGPQRDEFDKLANRMLDLEAGPRGVAVSFASSEEREGASFVSFNVARILAEVYGRKVVWIDANFMSPQQSLNTIDRVTLSQLLSSPRLLADIATTENPYLIPAGDDLKAKRGLFASSAYEDLIRSLTDLYDFVLIDLPPVLRSNDTALMSAKSRGLLLVVEQEHLKWEVIKSGVEVLEDKGVDVLGAVINRRRFALPKIIYDRI